MELGSDGGGAVGKNRKATRAMKAKTARIVVKKKECMRKYYKKNKARIVTKKNEYYQNNKARIAAYLKEHKASPHGKAKEKEPRDPAPQDPLACSVARCRKRKENEE